MLIESKYHGGHIDKPLPKSWNGPRRRHRTTFLTLTICFLLLYYFRSPPFFPSLLKSQHGSSNTHCPQASISREILVVMRTGATEVLQKLPIHFETTLRCVPNYVIYSDYEEDIQGNHVFDVLDEVSDVVKDTVPEFQLYKHLKEHGREGLNSTIHLGSGPIGSLENPAWKLDRFKFLPMIEKALRYRPDTEWFVFIEPDTYLVWANLLAYLSKFDANKPYYIGKHMYIGDVLFAHGGSGFILSKAPIQKVAQHWKAHVDEYDQYTIQQWAGDMVLGKALRDVDVPLFWAFPHFQGESVSLLDHNITKIGRRPWCFAPITYHHMRQDEIRMLWDFEQKWYQDNNEFLRHRDVFKDFIAPYLSQRRDDWDNLSIGTEYTEEALSKLSGEAQQAMPEFEREAHKSFDNCRATCQSKIDCLQYSYAPGKCSTSNEVRKGYSASSQCLEYSNAAGKCVRADSASGESSGSVQSGWMIERMSNYMQDMTKLCDRDSESIWVT